MITRLPLAALITASLFWGTAVSVIKHALCGFGPIPLLAISLIAGTAVLWTIVILRGHRPPDGPARASKQGTRPRLRRSAGHSVSLVSIRPAASCAQSRAQIRVLTWPEVLTVLLPRSRTGYGATHGDAEASRPRCEAPRVDRVTLPG